MKTELNDLVKMLNKVCPTEGHQITPVPNVICTKISESQKRKRDRWRSSIAIVAQGTKEVQLGRTPMKCGPGHYTVSLIDLPVHSRVLNVTKEKPFIALLVRIDPTLLQEVASQFEDEFAETEGPLFAAKASDDMLECSLRLARLMQNEKDARALGPLVVKELIYHVLKGPEGPAIRKFVRSGSKLHKISKAIHDLKSDLASELDVEALAKSVNMSRAVFFRHFKDVSSMSPIQYQKRLRLLEAQRLMVEESETAESASYRVGYERPSQFSREYSRMFGVSPKRSLAASRR